MRTAVLTCIALSALASALPADVPKAKCEESGCPLGYAYATDVEHKGGDTKLVEEARAGKLIENGKYGNQKCTNFVKVAKAQRLTMGMRCIYYTELNCKDENVISNKAGLGGIFDRTIYYHQVDMFPDIWPVQRLEAGAKSVYCFKG